MFGLCFVLLVIPMSSGQHSVKPKKWIENFEEPLFNTMFLRENVFKSEDNPKYWAAYTNKSVFESMCHIFSTNQHFGGIFTFIDVELFHKILLQSWWRITDFVYVIEGNNTFSTVRHPVGQVFAGAHGCQLYKPRSNEAHDCVSLSNTLGKPMERKAFFLVYKWVFQLDHHLRLNVSVQHLKIMVKNLFDCFVGHLSVQESTTNYVMEKYCGILSNIVLYPTIAHFRINLGIKFLVTFQVHIVYSVIDKKQIVSVSPQLQPTPGRPVWAVVLTRTHIHCEKFHLEQERTNRILIVLSQSSESWVEIFDGPGTLYQKLNANCNSEETKSYLTSLFQCVVFVRHSQRSFTKNLNTNFTFQGQQKPIDHYLVLNQTAQQDQHPGSNSNINMTKVKTHKYFHVNVTITSLTISHKRNKMCHFGGLAAYERDSQVKNNIAILCSQHSYVFKHRNIYSTNNSLMLIVYSYHEYGSLNVSLDISRTACDKTHVDACMRAEPTVLLLPTDTCVVVQLQNQLDGTFYSRVSKCGMVSCNEHIIKFRTDSPG